VVGACLSTELRYGIKEFSQPNLRRGSLDSFSGYSDPLLGQQIHASITRDDPCFHKEYSLSFEAQFNACKLHLNGRCDGVYIYEDQIIVEEVKTTPSVELLCDKLYDEHPYVLQAKTYAWILHNQHQLPLKVKLCLVSTKTLQESEYWIDFDPEEHFNWVNQRCVFLLDERAKNQQKQKARNAVAQSLSFPFSKFRPMQDQMIDSVLNSIEKAQLISAPTGLGKTMGSVYPMLKKSLLAGTQLVYTTPKNTQLELAEDAVESLRKGENHILSVRITSKAKSCMQKEPICHPDLCPYARDFYTKLDQEKIIESIECESGHFGKDEFNQLALKYEVCPFELSLEAALKADVISCDYNYVFSPRYHFQRLAIDSEGESKNVHLIVDEIHNLVERSLQYFSPEIDQTLIEQIIIEPKMEAQWADEFRSIVQRFLQSLSFYESKTQDQLVSLEQGDFFSFQRELQDFSFRYYSHLDSIQPNESLRFLKRMIDDFCFGLDAGVSHSLFLVKDYGRKIKILCCDASEHLCLMFAPYAKIVGISATLRPHAYYKSLLGLPENTPIEEYPSPFPRANRRILLIPQVSTKFKDRTKHYHRIAEIIKRITALRQGNYIVFYPSYDFLQQIYTKLDTPGFRSLVQQPSMGQEDAQVFIDSLRSQSRRIIIHAVQGGIFSEGLDFPGDLLIGAIIVGPGLPSFDFERKLLMDYYEKVYKQGAAYALHYPAMTKVIQAAGRVIRTETDKGIIVLLDDRFLEKDYYEQYPKDWIESSPKELVSQSITKDIEDFWQQ
jgi:DNA excision repair protein ERCC-2